MKRLIALIPDDFDLGEIAVLFSKAQEIKIEKMEETKLPRPPIVRHRASNGRTSLNSIMDHYTHGAIFPRQKAIEWLNKEGFAGRKTVSGCLSRLVDGGYISKDSKDNYRFLSPYPKQ